MGEGITGLMLKLSINSGYSDNLMAANVGMMWRLCC